jgi:hypothetical protein
MAQGGAVSYLDAEEPPPGRVVFARGISILNSRTFWLNALALVVAIIVLPEVGGLIPERFVPIYSAVLAISNIILRVLTVRPVALVAPGSVVVVPIPKIDPPSPPPVTD